MKDIEDALANKAHYEQLNMNMQTQNVDDLVQTLRKDIMLKDDCISK